MLCIEPFTVTFSQGLHEIQCGYWPVSSRWRFFFIPCEDENQLFPYLVCRSKLNSSLQFHIFPGCCSPVFLAQGGATQWRESKCLLQPLHPPWAPPQGSTTSSPQLCSKEHPYTLIAMIKYTHKHTYTSDWRTPGGPAPSFCSSLCWLS